MKHSEQPKPESTGAPEYWRSLAEAERGESFPDWVAERFPSALAELGDGVHRRRFLQLMGASIALGGAAGCTRQPPERILPFVRQPEDLVPGRPLFYATSANLRGSAIGLLVESHEGRPTKIEGNPAHPASLGSSDALAQATILSLYDPDRSRTVQHLGRISSWSAFLGVLGGALRAQRAIGGEGLRILSGTITSPTLAAQREAILAGFPKARWVQYEAAGRHSARRAADNAFGRPVHTRYDLAKADVILSLDCDLLVSEQGSVRYARDFGSGRRVLGEERRMNRLYAVESAPTSTGTLADHRLSLTSARVEGFAAALAAKLGVEDARTPAGFAAAELASWIAALAEDLEQHRGRGLVVAGEQASPALHVLAHAINQRLGNVGETVIHTEPIEATAADQPAELAELADDLRGDRVDTLLVLGCNPVYDAPAELDFAAALNRQSAALRVHLGLYDDETAEYCHWHLPQSHFLESWSDDRAYDGTVSIVQPLIQPLFDGRSAHELLAAVLERIDVSDYDLVREQWQDQLGTDFEQSWRKALHDGILANSAAPAVGVTVAPTAVAAALGAVEAALAKPGLELLLRPDPHLWDGRFANNGWLQECPRPLTKLTWDNALLLSPRRARDLGVENGDLIDVSLDARTVRVAAWVLPGQPDQSVTLHLGYGRRRAGKVAQGSGVDVYPLRTADQLWRAHGVELRRAGERRPLATTQEHHSMEGRHLVREASLAHYAEHPHFAHDVGHSPPADMTLYEPWAYEGYAWGMAINLSACTGCNACVVACQSENNIPVVGRDQVIAGREMHWIRIDRYWKGDPDDPAGVVHQPVPCMQCENAPCELVCPVGATVHSDEGLNDMVYNRCVGTRYCSNNCPYKVRRFNFFKYADYETPELKLMRNPDVTVRFRGVMEKCTYCVQRINHARIHSEREQRAIADGEIVTACQQACPTQAITFGDINDPANEVSRWKAEPLSYGLLEELNTRPRTTYLARLQNLNPALERPHT